MTFLIHTYGCQMNVRDSDAVAAMLVAAGHTPTLNENEADIVIVNTCSVREKAEDKAIGKLRMLCCTKNGRKNRIVGAMGCMAQRMGKDIFQRVNHLNFSVGARAAKLIVSALKEAQETEDCQIWLPGEITDHDVPHGHLQADLSAYVTVLLGCNRRCAYCIVPEARGPEYSRPADEIIAEARCLVERGVREITLLGQSVLNYGRQREDVWQNSKAHASQFTEPFPRLLEALSEIEGLRRIRFTSGHPSGCTEELARAMRDLEPVCAHMHLPVQSGSDRILRLMRRGYTREQYLEAVARLREHVPDVSLTTDVIVGFPSETDEDFEATRELMRQAKFDNSFIFKFSPRPGTCAAEMADDVPQEEKERRNKRLLADQDELGVEINRTMIGRVVKVLVEGPSLRNSARFSGRSSQNKIVVFEPVEGLCRGDIVDVRLTRANPQTLFGKICGVEKK